MSVIVKCKSCNGTGYIPIGNGVRGLLVCKACNGVGTYENDEITIINDECYYKIPNGTSYVYETIPQEFKPYFDKLQQENNQLKELIDTILNWDIFKNECPMNFGYDEETNENKAQDAFYKDDDYCENNCNDDYTKCWLKYFKRIHELEKGDSNE